MSGGLAFVYDPDRRFAPLCNVDVAQDLFPVEDGEVGARTALLYRLVLLYCCLVVALLLPVQRGSALRNSSRAGLC